MNPLLLAFDQLAAATLITVIWQAALLTLAMAVLLRLLPRLSAATRFTAWLAVFVVLLFLPLAPHIHAGDRPTGFHRAGFHLDPRWSVVIVALWVALSLFRAIQLARGVLHLRTISRRAIPITLAPSPNAAQPATREASLCLSPDVLRPSVIGFFTPRILIPESLYARLTPAELDHILLHERQHLRRRDNWLNLLQKFVLVLFPLNPALLWVERRLCFERELACDESVLAVTNAPRSYARSLVSVAEHTILGRQLSLALGAWEQRSELSRRVSRILATPTPGLPTRSATVALALLCAGLLSAAAGLSRVPRLISFAPAPVSFAAANHIAARPHTFNDGVHRVDAVARVSSADSRPTLLSALAHPAQSMQPAKTLMRRAVLPRRHSSVPKMTLATETRPSREQRPTLQNLTIADESVVGQSSAQSLTVSPRLKQARTVENPPTTALAAVVFAVFQSPSGSPAYAAVSTPTGWLVIQL